MTDFEKTYQNYNPRQTALDEARALLTSAAKAAMADGTLPEAELPAFIVEIPADVKNGDIASNIAMAGARTWRKAPKMIADALIAHLPALGGGVFAKVEVAGPGFINLFLAPSFWAGVVLGACSNKEYGRTDHGKGAKYNVEFVSANPTGPMHMGNARGGALGDCLAAVLDWSGYDVTREFYINDAGNQIQKFGKSLAVRYLQKYCGEEAYPLPAECYQGGDIKVLAGEFAELNGDKYVASCKGMDEETLFESEAFAALKDALVAYALPKNIAALKRDLGKYRIDYDVWFHESTLHESGAVLAVVDKLLELGACYKAEDGAIMYRSAQYAAKYGTVNKKKTDDGTEEEAKEEAFACAYVLNGRKLDYPIFFDTEASGASNGSGRADGLGMEDRTKCAIAFCEEVKAQGYKPGVYASTLWYRKRVDLNSLKKYTIWNAHYGVASSPIDCALWQGTCTARLPGYKGDMDVNISYIG